MPLRPAVIPVQLTTGLDAGKDPKIVQQGLLRLENSVQRYTGEFRKRYGMRR